MWDWVLLHREALSVMYLESSGAAGAASTRRRVSL
jgi:hypothetical protein